jgi:Putative Ig domain
MKLTIARGFSALWVTLTLAGCGGGGGGTPATTAPMLETVAKLEYKAKNKATKVFNPWETVILEPVVSGTLGTATRTFSVDGKLPDGLSLDTETGVISGLTADVKTRSFQASVKMTAAGFSRDIYALTDFQIDGTLSEFGSFRGGFVGLSGLTISNGGWTCSGTVGVPGTVNFEVVYALGQAVAAPFPAGTTVTYSLISSTATGATINVNSGEINWTPTTKGAFTVQWAADVSNNGITRRYVGRVVTLAII